MGWLVLIWAIFLMSEAIKLNSPAGLIATLVMVALTLPPLWAKLKGRGVDTRPGWRWSAATVACLVSVAMIGNAFSKTPAGKEAAAKREAKKQTELEELVGAERAKDAEKAAKIATGEHCMSGWDGSLIGLKDAVKENLRNPKSFEHIETVRSPVDDKGTFGVIMSYRAENGFGGMNVEAIGVEVEAKTCDFRQVSEEALAARLRKSKT